jgi:ABC-2 type transport system ATP-binding protein
VSEPAVETRALSKRFGAKLALDGLDLRLDAGRIHAIVGANGAGKSTLFRILVGFLPASAGTARVLGRDCRELAPEDRARIGLVNEEHTLPGWMRVAALVAMQRRHYRRWDEDAFRELRGQFLIDDDQRVAQLSRGERAGLSLALAMGQAPELLVLDEPTLGLDVVAKRAVLEAIVGAAQRERRTIVYCSHQMEEVERLADHLVVIERGRVVCAAEPDDFLARVRLWLAEIPFLELEAARVPGLLQMQKLDGIHHLLVIDQGEEFAAFLRAAGARWVRAMQVSLDRAVSGLLASRRPAVASASAGARDAGGAHA